MFSLEDLLGQQQGSEVVNQIGQQVNAEPSLVNTAIQMALPAIISGLAKNAATPDGAQALDGALANDHDGSILDNLGGLGSLIFGGGQAPRQADAGGILGHILGGNQGQVTEKISNESGLNMGQVAQILMFLAPIVMGYLGRQKQQNNLDAGGISDLLTGQQQQIQQAPQGSFIERMLDSDGDGSAMDDIASMALKYMTGK
ncbi:MAG: DUF937 domain-containing protein [Acidobacteria bacterium]|nr:DUF937 domain-containing protein [Acidobacteriota bacterium]MBK8148057.1 DUF937 domain-containing protein [Acidobacteriota bacterium]